MGRKSRKFTKEERTIFQAGVSEGVSRGHRAVKKLKGEHKQTMCKLQLTITNCQKTNAALWEEVRRLDIIQPLTGVLLPRDAALRILSHLLKYNPCPLPDTTNSLVIIMQRCIKNADRDSLGPLTKHLTTIADESQSPRPRDAEYEEKIGGPG